MAAARSRDPVLAKIRLMWVLIVWLLRYKRPAISGLVSPRAMRPRISTSRWVRPSGGAGRGGSGRSEEHTSELQSLRHLVCRLLLEKKKNNDEITNRHQRRNTATDTNIHTKPN